MYGHLVRWGEKTVVFVERGLLAEVRLYLQESSKGLLSQDIYSLAALAKPRSNQPAVTIPLKF